MSHLWNLQPILTNAKGWANVREEGSIPCESHREANLRSWVSCPRTGFEEFLYDWFWFYIVKSGLRRHGSSEYYGILASILKQKEALGKH